MASQAKSGSRWGSFLQQAVAGVESRLDTILADSDESRPLPASQSTATQDRSQTSETYNWGDSPRQTEGLSRHSSVNRKAERLHDRLARAVINGNSTRSSSIAEPARIAAPSDEAHSDPPSPKFGSDESYLERSSTPPASNVVALDQKSPHPAPQSNGPKASDSGVTQLASAPQGSTSQSLDVQRTQLALAQVTGFGVTAENGTGGVQEESGSEAYRYLERIDMLEAKLRFMTETSAALAKTIAGNAEAGSSEKQLAEKDEKLALLMAEGLNLSQTEMKHLASMKKLRLKSSEDEKRLQTARRKASEAQKVARNLRDQLQHAGSMSSINRVDARSLEEANRELEDARAENASLSAKVVHLQKRVAEIDAAAPSESERNLRDSLSSERKRTLELENSIEAAKTSYAISEDHLRARLQEVQTTSDREKERARLAELDLRGELQIVETRLETYLSRAEEFSSDHAGENQAKLVRQVETLQNSYSVASENWREIEKSLLAQVSRLQSELSDTIRREADMRRKARECSGRCRELEVQVEKITQEAQEASEGWKRERESSSKVQTAFSQAQEKADRIMQDSKSPKALTENSEESLYAEVDSGMHSLRSRSQPFSQALSPVGDTSNSIRARQHRYEPGLGISAKTSVVQERPATARTLSQARVPLPTREVSSSSVAQYLGRDGNVEEQSVQRETQDILPFDQATTPATPDRTVNDMFSVSTAAAGPSVQLVERMSASVRRLESEKTALKDELDRHVAQRAEAREQIVALLEEVDRKREAEQRVNELEKEVKETSVKLATTLEMLGEKSELVEELRADIADMKEIYRSTLENTVR